jgi:hypothetical protein
MTAITSTPLVLNDLRNLTIYDISDPEVIIVEYNLSFTVANTGQPVHRAVHPGAAGPRRADPAVARLLEPADRRGGLRPAPPAVRHAGQRRLWGYAGTETPAGRLD